ncbi:MAG: uracil-DNA glycosylase [Candidatus Westeberhardia cardiocondylae]|nr:uracil-DNA glycosylase [Candidatus Westeberhardia cardiocondylae]
MNIVKCWRDVFLLEKKLFYFQNIFSILNRAYNSNVVIYPKKKDIFKSFLLTKFDDVKVVIVGQDPYHEENQANGLAFSVQLGVSLPPSLVNIYKELSQDIDGFYIPNHGCLESWARQGVLLLNSILTVEKGKSFSHANLGWEIFTDKIIKIINLNKKNIVFLLWGEHAKKKCKIINFNNHYVLKSSHPSPYSARYGFFGCRHFSKTNYFLKRHGFSEINWQI